MTRRAGLLRDLPALLAPRPGRLEYAIRLASVCILTTWIVQAHQTPEAALTAYLAFFVLKPDRTASVILSLVMLVVVTAVIGGVMLTTMVVIDRPVWRVAAMAVISFCLLFTASASKLKPIAATLALVTAYALGALGDAHLGEIATRALLYGWLAVAIPVAVSIGVNLVAGPSPRRLIERALAHRLSTAAALLRSGDRKARRRFKAALAETHGEMLGWLKLATLERTSRPEDLAALGQAVATITPILILVDLIDQGGARAWPAPVRRDLAETFEQMASILRRGAYPVAIILDPACAGPDLAPDDAAILAELKEALSGFAVAADAQAAGTSPAKVKSGFFVPDAFTNPEHVRYALKTTAAAMFCYLVYMLLDWPGIHTCLITCYIVALGTTAETVEKLTLRVIGCLVGAAAGLAAIVYVMPLVTSIGGLSVVVFVATFAAGWVAAGTPRISYAGFQIAFAFLLCVVQGSGPAFDLTLARDRVVGILFGDLTIYLVFTLLWPTSVGRRIDPAIVALLRGLGQMLTAAPAGRYRRASQVHAAGVGLVQDIGLGPYEPRTVRPAPAWLEARSAVAGDIAALEGPLLLSARGDPAFARTVGERLHHLADRMAASLASAPAAEVSPTVTVTTPGPPSPSAATGHRGPMRQAIEAAIDRLETGLAPPNAQGDADHAKA
jgi:multidrug resistance protein MdtO